MNNKFLFALLALMLSTLTITKSHAVNKGNCKFSDGNREKVLDVPTDALSNSAVGTIATSSSKDYIGVNAICPNTSSYIQNGDGTTYRSYRTSLSLESTQDSFQYLKVNDYLAVAVSISDDYSGRFYPPAEYVHMGWHPNVKSYQAFPVADSNLIYKFKVLKNFTGMLTIPQTTLFSVYVGANIGTYGLPDMTAVVYSLVLPTVTLSVPQTCEVNAGSIIDFDFGDISAVSFSRAGAGMKPSDVAVQSKAFNIKCADEDANSSLTLKLQTSNSSGNKILSSNADLGFIITDSSDHVIIPNDATSTITTVLDSTSQANVTIKAYPVSVTGNAPAEGVFSATAYLLIDFA